VRFPAFSRTSDWGKSLKTGRRRETAINVEIGFLCNLHLRSKHGLSVFDTIVFTHAVLTLKAVSSLLWQTGRPSQLLVGRDQAGVVLSMLDTGRTPSMEWSTHRSCRKLPELPVQLTGGLCSYFESDSTQGSICSHQGGLHLKLVFRCVDKSQNTPWSGVI
jgi:hypothetical protein